MLANAAGPVIALYCLAVGLPKFEVVGTLAWFFFIVNVFKLPFSAGLGLIRVDTLMLNLVLVPAVMAGVFSGRWIVHRLPQRAFDLLMLAFATIAALRLIFGAESSLALGIRRRGDGVNALKTQQRSQRRKRNFPVLPPPSIGACATQRIQSTYRSRRPHRNKTNDPLLQALR